MSNLIPTYVHEGGEVFAFFENRVIAQGISFAKVEETAVDYLEGLSKERKAAAEEKTKRTATHIVTPSGEKAQILSRVDGLWGEKEITIRTEKGRIVKLAAHGGNDANYQYTNEKVAATASEPTEALQAILDEDYGHDRDSLTARLTTLNEVVTQASQHVAGASVVDADRLHKFVLAANHEKGEVSSALEYLTQADAEAFAAPSPVAKVVDQAEMGRASKDSWLDITAKQIIAESEGQNFDKILAEEPALLAAELETGTLADQGSTAEIALSHITAKTAAFTGAEVESYRELFVAATEQARRAELKERQESTHKQAAKQEEEAVEAPDESLFI
jgi:hypothetical protein